MDYGRANLVFSGTLLDVAVQRGLRHVVICPGSRSTPLALAAALHPDLTTHVLIDERSAAYFALGMARQRGAPVALICTSGTAAANFAPAVIEAFLSRIPLLVLTADRPAELRDWGASQTIDQVDLYGGHTRWSRDLPAPVGDPMEPRFARSLAARAMSIASGAPAGPVHLNVQFREPLIPPDADPAEALRELYAASTTPSDALPQVPSPSSADIEQLVSIVKSHPRGIIVGGPHAGSELGSAVSQLSAATGYPCLADPLSSVRYAWNATYGLIDAYDMFLRAPDLAPRLTPELILRFGGAPTSKPLAQFLSKQTVPVVVIDPGDLRDPGHAATWHLRTDELATLQAVTVALPAINAPTCNDWSLAWQSLNIQTRKALDAELAAATGLNEPGVAADLIELMPPGGTLVVGNSMPVRDVDTFAAGGNKDVRVTGARGASGIDGVTSTAFGASAVANGPVALLVGDLSFLHDLGGLQASSLARTPVVILVVNNDGGGIFSFLPQHTQLAPDAFELLFGTPAAVDIEVAARLFRCDYVRPGSSDEFQRAVKRGLGTPRVTIVEVCTDRAENLALHRTIAAKVLAELADHPAA